MNEHKSIEESPASELKIRKTTSDTTRLINIAIKAGSLAYEISRSDKSYRLAGRLNRLIQFPMSELGEEELKLSPSPTFSLQ